MFFYSCFSKINVIGFVLVLNVQKYEVIIFHLFYFDDQLSFLYLIVKLLQFLPDHTEGSMHVFFGLKIYHAYKL